MMCNNYYSSTYRGTDRTTTNGYDTVLLLRVRTSCSTVYILLVSVDLFWPHSLGSTRKRRRLRQSIQVSATCKNQHTTGNFNATRNVLMDLVVRYIASAYHILYTGMHAQAP